MFFCCFFLKKEKNRKTSAASIDSLQELHNAKNITVTVFYPHQTPIAHSHFSKLIKPLNELQFHLVLLRRFDVSVSYNGVELCLLPITSRMGRHSKPQKKESTTNTCCMFHKKSRLISVNTFSQNKFYDFEVLELDETMSFSKEAGNTMYNVQYNYFSAVKKCIKVPGFVFFFLSSMCLPSNTSLQVQSE